MQTKSSSIKILFSPVKPVKDYSNTRKSRTVHGTRISDNYNTYVFARLVC